MLLLCIPIMWSTLWGGGGGSHPVHLNYIIKTVTLRAIWSDQACSNTTCSSQRIPFSWTLHPSFFFYKLALMAAEQTLCLLLSGSFSFAVPNLFAGEFTTIREFQLPIGMSWRQGPSLIGGKCIFYGGPPLLRTKRRCSSEYRFWLAARKTFQLGLSLIFRPCNYLGNPVMLITIAAHRHTSDWDLREKKKKLIYSRRQITVTQW